MPLPIVLLVHRVGLRAHLVQHARLHAVPEFQVVEVGHRHAVPPVVVERIDVARHAEVHKKDVAVRHRRAHLRRHDGRGGIHGGQHDVGLGEGGREVGQLHDAREVRLVHVVGPRHLRTRAHERLHGTGPHHARAHHDHARVRVESAVHAEVAHRNLVDFRHAQHPLHRVAHGLRHAHRLGAERADGRPAPAVRLRLVERVLHLRDDVELP